MFLIKNRGSTWCIAFHTSIRLVYKHWPDRAVYEDDTYSALRKNCPNTELFLAHIFLDLDWIRRFTKYIWLETTFQSSTMHFWTVTFFKLTLRSDCLELYFGTVDFKNHPDSVIQNASRSQTRTLNNLAHYIVFRFNP